jgi:hypothetical protein
MQIWKRMGVVVSPASITVKVGTGLDLDSNLSGLGILMDGDPG